MKTHYLPILGFVVLIAASFSAQAQTPNPFVRPTQTRIPEVYAPQPTQLPCLPNALPINCWVGRQIIILPKPERERTKGYQNFSSAEGSQIFAPYEDLVGKIATVTSANFVNRQSILSYWKISFRVEGFDAEYMATSEATALGSARAQIPDIALLSDLQAARQAYLGKPLWVLTNAFPQLVNDNTSYLVRFREVAVTDVLASEDVDNPVRLVFTQGAGPEVYWDFSYSHTNTRFLTSVRELKDNFLVQDPKKTKRWSERAWRAIAEEKVFVGMTQEQARWSWGEPNDINRTTGTFGVHEQWVYGSKSYIYFENGVLSSIQN